MKIKPAYLFQLTLLIFFISLSGCASVQKLKVNSQRTAPSEQDRQAIRAMAGNYKVTFDFTETVSFVQGYEKKKPYVTGATEIVRVIENKPGFISLQHILLVGDTHQFPIKHWRQDWIYEPESIHEFVGFNSWKKRDLKQQERQGKWAQVVYQVDDSPRYAGLAAWQHDNGISQWASEVNMRPLPRRDMTKRDDYDAILAVNRHAVTPNGWVHEQDNSKLILRSQTATLLAREIGINTYVRDDQIAFSVADDYWHLTKDYWQAVRDKWSEVETNNAYFSLTIQGEPTALYMPMLEYAGYVKDGKMGLAEAINKAHQTIDQYTTNEPLRPSQNISLSGQY
jgi:hypothetical protein